MATYAQRAQSIADALINGTATLSQINRLGLGFAASEGRESEYSGLTNAQKAEFVVRYCRRTLLAPLVTRDQNAAASTATATVPSSIESEFAEL